MATKAQGGGKKSGGGSSSSSGGGSSIPGAILAPGMAGEIAYPIFTDENGTTYKTFHSGAQFTVPKGEKAKPESVDPAPESDPPALRERSASRGPNESGGGS